MKVHILTIEHHDTNACETTMSVVGAYSNPRKAMLAICNTYPSLNWIENGSVHEAELVVGESNYLSFEIKETAVE